MSADATLGVTIHFQYMQQARQKCDNVQTETKARLLGRDFQIVAVDDEKNVGASLH